MRVLHVALFALLLSGLPTSQADEARTYMSLWGSLFSAKNSSGSSRSGSSGSGKLSMLSSLHSATESLREGAAGAHAKLLQRLADLSLQRQNQTSGADDNPAASNNATALGLPQLRSLFGGSTAAHWDDARSGAPFNLTAALLGEGAGGNSTSLLQRLMADLSSLDYHQLVTIAMLQGWALAALLGGKHSMHDLAESMHDLAESMHGMGDSRHSRLGALVRRETPQDDVVQVADPNWPGWQPAACIGLQNFGGAEGYRAAYLGPPPCGSPDSSAIEQLAWGGSAAFLLQCDPAEAEVVDPGQRAAPAGDSVHSAGEGVALATGGRALLSLAQSLRGAIGEQQGAFTKLSSLLRTASAAPSGGDDVSTANARLTCHMAVTSSAGRGSLLRHGAGTGTATVQPQHGGLALPYTGEVNALQVRVCNTAPSSLQSPASSGGGSSSSSVVLRDLLFGGKAVLPKPLAVSRASGGSSGSGGCTMQLYHLGGKGVSKGAVVSGWVELVEGSESGGSGGFGVGDMASVVVAVGHYSPIAE